MKVFTKKQVFFVMTLLSLVLSGCNQNVSHVHSFNKDWSCDEIYHWHATNCEHTDLKADLKEHDFGDFVSNNDATIENDGTKTRSCLVCDYEETVVDIGSKIHVHTYSTEWTSDDNYHWHYVTCEHETIPVNYISHKWDGGVVTKTPTYTEEGICLETCVECKHTRENKISKLVLSSDESDLESIANDNLFYFSYENSFDLSHRYHYVIQLKSGDKVVKEVDLAEKGLITTDYTPKQLYDYTHFVYEIPLKYNSNETTVEGIDITEFISKINSTKIKVFIAVRGDYDLNSKTEALDASDILVQCAEISVAPELTDNECYSNKQKLVFQQVLGCNYIPEDFINKYLWKYCDVTGDGQISAADASCMLSFYALEQTSVGNFDIEATWKKILGE